MGRLLRFGELTKMSSRCYGPIGKQEDEEWETEVMIEQEGQKIDNRFLSWQSLQSMHADKTPGKG